jgi:ATP-dependent 26S proteasome regulatory subunit
VNTIHHNPEKFEKYGQTPCFNALLYGPPGSGKSSFSYRVARALGRNIDCINLYSLVQSGNLSFIKKLFSYSPNINKTVFVLDEFDNAITYIYEKNNEKNEKNNEKNSDSKLAIATFKRPVITMEDLLSLFQGAIPDKGRIIFATTNNYEKLREMCPALFRCGRLSPIHFDYLDWDSLNDLSNFYFGKSLRFNRIEKCKIPTSEIIELAMELVVDEKFDQFESKLYSLLTAT